MKRLLDITLLIILFIHFACNMLPNIIGVPLAAYHSYQAWKDAETINHSDFHPKIKNQKQLKSNREAKVDQKDS